MSYMNLVMMAVLPTFGSPRNTSLYFVSGANCGMRVPPSAVPEPDDEDAAVAMVLFVCSCVWDVAQMIKGRGCSEL